MSTAEGVVEKRERKRGYEISQINPLAWMLFILTVLFHDVGIFIIILLYPFSTIAWIQCRSSQA